MTRAARRNAPGRGDAARRRQQRDVQSGAAGSVADRLAAEAAVLRSGDDWRARVPVEPGEWNGNRDPLLTLDNESETHAMLGAIERWLLNRLIVGDYSRQEAADLWRAWINASPYYRRHRLRVAARMSAVFSLMARFTQGLASGGHEPDEEIYPSEHEGRRYPGMLGRPLVAPDEILARDWVGDKRAEDERWRAEWRQRESGEDPARPNPDERTRDLERKARLGDAEAQAQLDAMLKRSRWPNLRKPDSAHALAKERHAYRKWLQKVGPELLTAVDAWECNHRARDRLAADPSAYEPYPCSHKETFPRWYLPSSGANGSVVIFYYDRDHNYYCAECANRLDHDWIEGDLAYSLFYEGPPEMCDGCNEPIESAYGDPEATDERGNCTHCGDGPVARVAGLCAACQQGAESRPNPDERLRKLQRAAAAGDPEAAAALAAMRGRTFSPEERLAQALTELGVEASVGELPSRTDPDVSIAAVAILLRGRRAARTLYFDPDAPFGGRWVEAVPCETGQHGHDTLAIATDQVPIERVAELAACTCDYALRDSWWRDSWCHLHGERA